jgi:hypothetical protein
MAITVLGKLNVVHRLLVWLTDKFPTVLDNFMSNQIISQMFEDLRLTLRRGDSAFEFYSPSHTYENQQ